MSDATFRRRPPVRWLAPMVLLKTLLPVAMSGLFARFSDRREVEAVLPQGVIDLSDGAERWVDYVADTGDGFDATATVASLLAPATLAVDGHDTTAGSLLVLGGDEVYPVASLQEYHDRFKGPFRAMLPCADPKRTVVALPGNHDWYDGLTAFLQLFCGRQWIGGWETVQRRSYFACQLPNRWWLWGIDIQLDTYIDHPQLDYFRAAAAPPKKGESDGDAKMRDGDGIILCWAKPSWVEAGEETPKAYDVLDYFLRTVVPEGVHVRVSLTGDAHHYAHYVGPDGEHKITAGLGGAFQSATHHLPCRLTLPGHGEGAAPVTFVRTAEYPTCEVSRAQRRGVLRGIRTNDYFAVVPALAQGLVALVHTRSRGRAAGTLAVAAIVTAACVGFSKPKKAVEWWPGMVHGAAQVATALASTAVVGRLAGRRRPVVLAGAAAVGAAVGPVLFAGYLVVADHLGLFGRNVNELYAAQAIEDHKGFLRLHFEPEGDLVIYPIKVDKVPHWVEDGTWPEPIGGPRFRPLEPPAYALIEEPIRVTRTP